MSHVKFRFEIQAEAHGEPASSSAPVGPHSAVQGVTPYEGPSRYPVTYPIKVNVYCDFSMYENGLTILKVEGEPEVVATLIAAWWTQHGADHIRDRLGTR